MRILSVLQRQFSDLECNAAMWVLCGVEISILVLKGKELRISGVPRRLYFPALQ
jgi:hypothetical protein